MKYLFKPWINTFDLLSGIIGATVISNFGWMGVPVWLALVVLVYYYAAGKYEDWSK